MKKIILVLFCVFISACDKKKTATENQNLPTDGGQVSQGQSPPWLSGNEIPAQSLGSNGEFYLQANGNVFIKKQDQWVLFTSLIGPQGLQGIQGVPGQPGISGPKGDQGLQGLQGLAGPVGPQGPSGPQGVKGDSGNQGPAGINGRDGLNGLNANSISLTAKVGSASNAWISPKMLRVKIPTNIEVVYGTGGDGAMHITLAARIKCVYRGLGMFPNSRPGTTDYEVGKTYQFEKCVAIDIADADIQNITSVYKNAAAIDISTGYDLGVGESLMMKILSAGTRISGAKTFGLITIL